MGFPLDKQKNFSISSEYFCSAKFLFFFIFYLFIYFCVFWEFWIACLNIVACLIIILLDIDSISHSFREFECVSEGVSIYWYFNRIFLS